MYMLCVASVIHNEETVHVACLNNNAVLHSVYQQVFNTVHNTSQSQNGESHGNPS